LHKRGILFAVIPGGLTSLLQPCDVAWFKTLKHHIAISIDEWKARPNHELTRGGNPRPPTNDDMSAWLANAWRSINPDLITNSFQRCFLGNELGLHIAQHEFYGDLFCTRIAESMRPSGPEVVELEISDASDVGDIDDE